MFGESSYDVLLVVLAYLVAVFGSFTALQLAVHIPKSDKGAANRWSLTTAIALGGCAIWAMNFIALLAYKVPGQVEKHLIFGLLSLIGTIIVVAASFYMVGRSKRSVATYLITGLVAGVGVSAMQFVSIYSMYMNNSVTWQWESIALSVVLSIGGAIVVLWLAFNLLGNMQRFATAFVIGLMLIGLHYASMAAVHIPTQGQLSSLSSTTAGASNEVLGLALFIFSVVLLSSLLVVSTKAVDFAMSNSDLSLEKA